MTLKNILKKHPNAYIYYHDSMGWTIYTSKKDFERVLNYKGDYEDQEQMFRDITLLQGSDDSGNGYIPELVEKLAKALGLEVGTI